jgi:hypothetical protein
MKKNSTIDIKNQHDNIDIVNMGCSDYSIIMISIDNMIKHLKKPIKEIYLDVHRKQLLKKYQDLFQKMLSNEDTWRGQTVCLYENVIEAINR